MNFLYRKNEEERIGNLLEEGKRFVYVSLDDKEIKNIKERNFFPKEWTLGVPAINKDRKAYYTVRSRVKNKITFQKIMNLDFLVRMALRCHLYIITMEDINLRQKNLDLNIIRIDNKKNFTQCIKKILNDTKKPVIAINASINTHTVIEELSSEYPMVSFIDISYISSNENAYSGISDFQLQSTTDFSVTVVLTLYKRPEVLERQYQAIKKQSLLPAEIILFQDQVQKGKRLVIDENIKSMFNKVEIADNNVGVWGRFRSAKDNATSPYVCLFDDDTIPGERWLENCHFHMQDKAAIYATLGIRLLRHKGYPYNGFYRIGWCSANKKCEKVDFAGHAWFIKKEWLAWMFQDTEKYQQIRYAAEDMCLSVKAAEHNIPTMILPHPYRDKELWGSQYEYALKYGDSSVALSTNGNNENMYNAVDMLIDDGWEPMCTSRKLYLNVQYILQKIREKIIKLCGIRF